MKETGEEVAKGPCIRRTVQRGKTWRHRVIKTVRWIGRTTLCNEVVPSPLEPRIRPIEESRTR